MFDAARLLGVVCCTVTWRRINSTEKGDEPSLVRRIRCALQFFRTTIVFGHCLTAWPFRSSGRQCGSALSEFSNVIHVIAMKSDAIVKALARVLSHEETRDAPT
jgi:hypothetical protein